VLFSRNYADLPVVGILGGRGFEHGEDPGRFRAAPFLVRVEVGPLRVPSTSPKPRAGPTTSASSCGAQASSHPPCHPWRCSPTGLRRRGNARHARRSLQQVSSFAYIAGRFLFLTLSRASPFPRLLVPSSKCLLKA
jgi:hypothetical protein